jgi:hypothetical protein
MSERDFDEHALDITNSGSAIVPPEPLATTEPYVLLAWEEEPPSKNGKFFGSATLRIPGGEILRLAFEWTEDSSRIFWMDDAPTSSELEHAMGVARRLVYEAFGVPGLNSRGRAYVLPNNRIIGRLGHELVGIKSHCIFGVECGCIALVRLSSGKLGLYAAIEFDWDELKEVEWEWQVSPMGRRGKLSTDWDELNDGVKAALELITDGNFFKPRPPGVIIPLLPSSFQGLVLPPLEPDKGNRWFN